MGVALHYGTVLGRPITFFMVCYLPSPQALRISHRGERETRVTGNEAQWTMGKNEEDTRSAISPFFSFPSSFACKFLSRERDVLVRGRTVAELRGKVALNLPPNIPIVHFDTTLVPRSGLLKSCL